MKIEDVIRKVFPGYRSKHELQEQLDECLRIGCGQELRISNVPLTRVRVGHGVGIDEYRRACKNGMYTMMRERIISEMSRNMANQLMKHINISMEKNPPFIDFSAEVMIGSLEPDGHDAFTEASDMVCL